MTSVRGLVVGLGILLFAGPTSARQSTAEAAEPAESEGLVPEGAESAEGAASEAGAATESDEAPAKADAAKSLPKPPAEPPDAVHPEGTYTGVVPGRGRPAVRAKRRAGAATVTWIGFQHEGTSRVFFQSTAPITVDQKIVGDELVVTMTGVRLGATNHVRPLDTSYFEAPIVRVAAARKGRAVEVRVKFRQGAARTAEAKSELGQDGYHYVYLDFGG
jgi:hypothetical protein